MRTAIGSDAVSANSTINVSLEQPWWGERPTIHLILANSVASAPNIFACPAAIRNTASTMIARVTLEMALRKEFDYSIPPTLTEQVDIGSRVHVPFGPRKVFGCVTALAEESTHSNLKPILKV